MTEQIYLQFKQPSSEFGFASTLMWNGDFSEQAVKRHSELLEAANNQNSKVWILFDKSARQPALHSLVSQKYSLVFTNISIPTNLKAENVRNFLLAQLPFASAMLTKFTLDPEYSEGEGFSRDCFADCFVPRNATFGFVNGLMQMITDIDANLKGNANSTKTEDMLGVFLQSEDNPAKPYYNITEHFVKCLSGDLKISAKLVGRNIFCLHYESPRRRGEREGGQNIDILSSEGVEALIHQVCEPYASMFKNYFGKTIPGFCIEPPDFLSCEPDNLNELPWTPEFLNYFSKIKNYNLLEMLPLLFYDSYDSASVRHDFWQVLTLKFAEVCITRLRNWASGYGIKLALTQPLIAHSLTQNSLPLFAEADIPAIHEPDVKSNLQSSKRLILFKQAVSIAEQFRKPYILFKTSDQPSCPRTEASLVKWVNNLHWAIIAGGNRFASNLRFDDSINKTFDVYLRRLSYMLSCGQRCCNLLVLNPIGSLWVKFGHQNYHWINSELASISEALIHSHHDFDFGDEHLIAVFGQVNRNSEFGIRNSELNRARKGKKLIIGDVNYSAVLIPPCINLQGKTVDVLRHFTSARGKLIAMEPLPYLMDGKAGGHSYPLERLLYSRRTTILRGTQEDKLRQLELLLNKIAGDGIEIYAQPFGSFAGSGLDGRSENLKARSILKHHRKYGELDICLFLNTDQNKVDALIEVKGNLHVEEWNLGSGEKYSPREISRKSLRGNHILFPISRGEPVQWHADNKTYVELQFSPWQMRLLVIIDNR
jgi:hypothetical protein